MGRERGWRRVDASVHAIGTPIFVDAPKLTHAGPGGGSQTGEKGFSRLMIAQDVGSAIRGPERGDLYFGSGDVAGRLAGITKHPGHLFVLRARKPDDDHGSSAQQPQRRKP